MANIQYGGFRPWGTFSGGQGNFPRSLRAEVANNYSTGIFKYDIISQVSDGTVAVSAAADNGKLLGVVIGCSYVTGGQRVYSDTIPASTTFSPTTVGSPNASFVDYLPLTGDLIMAVQADDGSSITSVAGAIGVIGENCDLVTGTGDTSTGLGAMLLDISTHATTTSNFRIVGINGYGVFGASTLAPNINDVTLTRADYLVVCNEGFLPPYTTTGV
jgi:hypothetical protein